MKINDDNKIYEQQLKSGAITQEIYDAHKKENTKKSYFYQQTLLL